MASALARRKRSAGQDGGTGPGDAVLVRIVPDLNQVMADERDRRYLQMHGDQARLTEQMGAGLRDALTLQNESLRTSLAEQNLREQQRFDAKQQALRDALLNVTQSNAAALVAAEKAVTKAEVASEKRFDGVNEFRQALSDQTKSFVNDSVFQARTKAIDDKIDILLTAMNQQAGRGNNEQIAALQAQITALLGTVNQGQGRGIGQAQIISYVLGAAGLVAILERIIGH
jgi:hypothetical protein